MILRFPWQRGTRLIANWYSKENTTLAMLLLYRVAVKFRNRSLDLCSQRVIPEYVWADLLEVRFLPGRSQLLRIGPVEEVDFEIHGGQAARVVPYFKRFRRRRQWYFLVAKILSYVIMRLRIQRSLHLARIVTKSVYETRNVRRSIVASWSWETKKQSVVRLRTFLRNEKLFV